MTISKKLRLSLTAAFILVPIGAALAGGRTPAKNPRASSDPNDVNFVRPGLVITVTGADIAADGTITARFKLADPKGLPLDRLGITTPGTISVSLIAATIPAGKTQYWSYTTRVQKSPITGASAVQASGENTGTFTPVGDGEYSYKFLTKAPADIDRAATHTIGAYGSRNLTEFDMGTQYSDTVYHFVPNGSKVTVVRDVIQTPTCNKCHQDVGFHGGPRKSMEVCVLCHQPQTWDPDTGNTVDMPVMTHRIHQGSGLPSVVAGNRYVIIGNGQSTHDFSDVTFPADVRNCQVCHEQGKAAQAANIFKPTRAACGSCHDDINFASGENHVNLPQISDNQCANCHQKQGEQQFDASILGAHVVPRFAAALPGFVMNIVKVSDAAPGKKPTVQFTVKDKAGNPIPPAKWDRLAFRLVGPTTDYSTPVLSEDARKAADSANGIFSWTFANALPANATGSWGISMEGRSLMTLNPGTKKEIANQRDSGINKTVYVSVDASPMAPRRQVVTTEKCNACHYALALHGDARNQVENCVTCHNPTLVAGTGAASTPVSFSLFVHRIHRGADLVNPYVIGNTNYQEVGYPGDLRNCSACHVNGSEQLPLKDGLMSVVNPKGPVNPIPPVTAACTGCHDRTSTLSHALANTTVLGESCDACHGTGSDFSVDRIHKH